MPPERFTIAVPDAALEDLQARLARTRWAEDFGNADWRYGTNADYLRRLVRYWQAGYDWRREEAAINRFEHYRVTLDDVPIHFMRVPGKGPRPLPLILSHGWPWTFWDWHKVVGPLADPASHGGDPQDAFEVVVPSLPGFGFSTPLRRTGIGALETADLWQRLMVEVLGFERFAAHGGDWGAFVTTQLGHKHAGHLAGIHLVNGAPLDMWEKGLPQAADYAPDEAGWYEKTRDFFSRHYAYATVQTETPQTLAYALNDSPVGLCAWLVDKRREWSDCGGDVERAYTRDELLTSVMLYWVTGSIGTAARYYAEGHAHPWTPSHGGTPVVDTPTAVVRFENDVVHWPKRAIEQHFDLRRWTRRAEGGHFAAMERPDFIVEDLRAFFRGLRG